MDKPDTLLMFSGGLDSTGLFWMLMREGCSLHVHHLRLFNVENRALAEDRAVSRVVEYMRGLGSFGYSESRHDYPCYGSGFVWDSDIFSFMAGSICLSMGSVRRVAVGMTLSDVRGGLDARVGRANRIFGAFGVGAEKVYPLSSMTKAQVYDMMPEDLRVLSWSCRTPVYEGGEILECGRCVACSEMSRVRGPRRP